MIKVENLCKTFGRNKAVDDVSFDISGGEIVGFLGPNGAGKTTTMRMITTYLARDRGRIVIGGRDVDEDPLGVRQEIGYLPEAAPLYHDLAVAEYLKYVAAIRRIPSSRRRERLREIVQACGLDDVLGRKIGFLSKGYRQRVGLAQSLVHDPRILILDEPTSGLDPNQIAEIRALISSIGREKTVILSTHILPEVQTTCNRVLIIDRGRIVADGRPDRLAAAMGPEGASYHVAIRGDAQEIEAAFKAASFLKGFARGKTENGLNRYVLTPAGAGDIGEAIFRLAVAGNFALAELRRETASLESIFARLTMGDNDACATP